MRDVIDNHNDPVKLRLLEALEIRKLKPEINSREECAELKDLLFWLNYIYFLRRPFVLNISTEITKSHIYIPAIVLSYCLLNPYYLA